MYKLKEHYRGVELEFEGHTKQELVEALAGVDYLLTRQAAAAGDEAKADDKATAKADDKPKTQAKRRPAKAKTEEKETPSAEPEEQPAAPAEEAEAKSEAPAAEQPEEKPVEVADKPVDLEDLREAVKAYAEANGAPQAKKMLAEFNAAKVSDIEESQRTDALKAFTGEA